MKKKFIAVVFAAMLAIASLAVVGCSSSSGSSDYTGNWVFVEMTSDDTTYTAEDVASVYTASEMCTLQINSDGTFDLLMFETSLIGDDYESATWTEVDGGIDLDIDGDVLTATYDSSTGYLTLATDDTTTLVLEKESE